MVSASFFVVIAITSVFAGGGLGLFGWATSERNRFDPLFQPVRCKLLYSRIDPMSINAPTTGFEGKNTSDPKVRLAMTQASTVTSYGAISKECSNPNQMNLFMETYKDGFVYVKRTEKDGTITLIDAGSSWVNLSSIPSGAAGNATTETSFIVGMPTVTAILMDPNPAQVVTRMFWRSRSEFTMLGRNVESAKEYERWCGFEARLKAVDSIIGPTACANTLEELEIPAIDSPQGVDEITLSDEDLAAGEGARDLFCGVLMALGLLSCCCCSTCGGFMAAKTLRGGAKTAPSGNTPVVPISPDEKIGSNDFEPAKKMEPVVCSA